MHFYLKLSIYPILLNYVVKIVKFLKIIISVIYFFVFISIKTLFSRYSLLL